MGAGQTSRRSRGAPAVAGPRTRDGNERREAGEDGREARSRTTGLGGWTAIYVHTTYNMNIYLSAKRNVARLSGTRPVLETASVVVIERVGPAKPEDVAVCGQSQAGHRRNDGGAVVTFPSRAMKGGPRGALPAGTRAADPKAARS